MPNFYWSRLSDNVAGIAGSSWTTTTAIESGYDTSWVADQRADRPSRISGPAGLWRVDLGSAQRVDIVGIINPTLATGSHFLVQASASGDFTSPNINVSLNAGTPWGDVGYLGNLRPTYKNLWVKLTDKAGYSTSGYRYWRFGSLDNTVNKMAIGEIWMGNLLRQLPNVAPGGNRRMRREVVTHQTGFGVDLSYDRGVTTREFDLTLVLKQADATAFKDWYMNAQANLAPSLIVPDDGEEECYMVKFSETTLPWIRTVRGDIQTVSVSFKELSRGVIV